MKNVEQDEKQLTKVELSEKERKSEEFVYEGYEE